MNKIFSLTLLAILFLGVYSCSEDEAGITENQTELTAKDIAKYHNIAVDLFEKSKAKMKCSSGVIAADAVGAGLGLFGGPVWSIIQGAVVSIAVNEDCDD